LTTSEINAMTIAEAGWIRLDAQTMRYTGAPIGGDGGRDILQIKGCRGGLAFTAAYLPPGIDPADAETVSAELDGEWDVPLSLPALLVLHAAIGSAIAAMEGARAAAATTEGNATP
jgi:hypothetical protein